MWAIKTPELDALLVLKVNIVLVNFSMEVDGVIATFQAEVWDVIIQ